MTEKQRRFAQAYSIDPNATSAAKAAGYSEKSAYSTGQRLLKNAEVRDFLHSINAPIEEEQVANTTEIRLFWSRVMNDPAEKTSTRLKASELLAKTSGMFTGDFSICTGQGGGGNGGVMIYLPEIEAIDDEENGEDEE